MNGFKYIREQEGKTMAEWAESLHVSKQLIYMWESGQKVIPEKRLLELEKMTGVPAKYFQFKKVFREDEMRIKNYQLRKRLEETVSEYEEMVTERDGTERTVSKIYYDAQLLENIEWQGTMMRWEELTEKIAGSILEYKQPDGERLRDHRKEWMDSMDKKMGLYARFIEIIESNPQEDMLFRMLYGLEMFSDEEIESGNLPKRMTKKQRDNKEIFTKQTRELSTSIAKTKERIEKLSN